MDLISVTRFLYYFSILLWIFPAIRQFQGRFFYFFLILGIHDPVYTLFNELWDFSLPLVYTVSLHYLLIPSLSSWKDILNNKYLLILPLIVFVVLSFFFNDFRVYFTILIIIHSIIFFKVFIFFLKQNVYESSINIFYVALLFYELTNILKVSNIMVGIDNAIANFILTSLFQILFGIYFSLFKDDHPKNFIKINP
ncbi:MAG: hypothetical protein PVH88_07675 [Ignavibacteria bacterium]